MRVIAGGGQPAISPFEWEAHTLVQPLVPEWRTESVNGRVRTMQPRRLTERIGIGLLGTGMRSSCPAVLKVVL